MQPLFRANPEAKHSINRMNLDVALMMGLILVVFEGRKEWCALNSYYQVLNCGKLREG